MSYTSVELLRRHLAATVPVVQTYYNQALKLTGNHSIRFFDGVVDGDSVRVKSPRHDIMRISCVLTDQTVTITNNPLVADSVVVGSDTSRGRIYRENADYVIDCHQSTIVRKASGHIALGQTVIIWYCEFHYYQADLDYYLNHNKGEIKRIASGNIADGETVYIDYHPVTGGLDDSLLNSIVSEVNGLIEAEIDPEGQYGADPVLQSAATSRAMELLGYVFSTRNLFTRGGEKQSSLWLKLAEKFAERAERLMAHFHPPLKGPSGPRKS